MIKSNIGIVSNIYIRSDHDIRKDKAYVEKITGAKLLRTIRQRYFGFETIPLTDVQNQILSGNQTCSFAKNGEMSFGPVMIKGKLHWISRCEYSACTGFRGCVPKSIPRKIEKDDYSEEKRSLQDFFKSLGIIIQDDTVVFERDKKNAKIEESQKEYVAPSEL